MADGCFACQQVARERVDRVRIRARLLRDEKKRKKAAKGAKSTLAGELPRGLNEKELSRQAVR